MSESSSGGIHDEVATRAAETERDLAVGVAATEAPRRQEREAEQEAARNAAITQAAHRDAAELVARNEAYILQEVEKAKRNAAIRAQQAGFASGEADDENGHLRRRLVAERKAASTATFSLVIASILLVACFIVGGAYYFSSQNPAGAAAAGVTPGAVASTANLTRSTDVAGPDSTPAMIHVASTPAAASGQELQTRPLTPAVSNTGGLGVSGAIPPTRNALGSDSGNLSGTMLGGDGGKPAGGAINSAGEMPSVGASDAGADSRGSSP